MIEFKISIIDRLVTYVTSYGIEKPLLKIEIPMPLYNECDYQFYHFDGKLAFNVVRTSEDPTEGDKEAITEGFKAWYGSLWNENLHTITVFDY